MGGAIGVRSKPGVGSTFWFTCNLKKVLPVPELPVANDLVGTKVLVIERHRTSREMLAQMLLSWGIDADQAADTSEALCMMELRGRHDVVMLDMHLSEVPTADTIRQLRSHPAAVVFVAQWTGCRKQAGRSQCILDPGKSSWMGLS